MCLDSICGDDTKVVSTSLESGEQIRVARRIGVDDGGICKHNLKVKNAVNAPGILSAQEAETTCVSQC